ncbi:MAG: xanthine dehydrogenase family protein subunit M [Desulfuromonadaceae bacterium]
MLPQFSYVRPDTIKDTVKQLQTSGAAIHAGGTDLLGCLRDGIISVDKVVSMSALPDMRGIQETSKGLRIGALTTISEVAENPLVQKHYAGLAQAANAVASPQLRNQGTLGGNLCQKPRCWYYRGEFACLRKGGKKCFALGGENQFHAVFGHSTICAYTHPSDTAPALVALGAQVVIQGPKGKRSLPVEKLHVLPQDNPQVETALESGEVITHIELPPPPAQLHSTYRKVRARGAWDFALAGLALALELDDGRVKNCRVVLSGAAPIPWRSQPVEKVLQGNQLTEATIAEAAQAIIKDAEPLAENRYKLDIFQGIIEEELAALA